MNSENLIYIILSGIIALFVALFQYLYKSKKKTFIYKLLTFLRFVSIFTILLLIINPQFEKVTFFSEKPNLILAVDNSESITFFNQEDSVKSVLTHLKNHEKLNEKFNIKTYTFNSNISELNDSLSFSGQQTNIYNAFSKLSEVYKNSIAPIVLITDGNQTFGPDYPYFSKSYNQSIYPIVVGDTTTYSDLKIQQLNVNRYAFFKNKFPVEIFVTYSGTIPVRSKFKILHGNHTVFSKTLEFSKNNTSQIIKPTLGANNVGIQTYKAIIEPLSNEKNKINNTKNFAIEVIDQKTNIALVSSIKHPDIGALKTAIEQNDQRSVSILTPAEFVNHPDNYQLLILYQPNRDFKAVYEIIKSLNLNVFTIAGTQTQWNTVNTFQSVIKQNITNQIEEFQPAFNSAYSTFIVDETHIFDNFPPLKTEFGKTVITVPEQIIAYKSIDGVQTTEPLLSTYEIHNQKFAFLNGEGIWRWRQQCFLDSKSFDAFDTFLGKLIQYLSSNQKRNRLNIDYESFYNGSEQIKLRAQFFNKNYELDTSASLEMFLKNVDTNQEKTIPFVLKNSVFEIDLSGIAPGKYTFVVKNNNENISVSGVFEVLEYNAEQQFLNANVDKLKLIAQLTDGKSYFINDYQFLIEDLINNEKFATIQKSNKRIVPIIDWTILLAILVLSLSLEWFIRKYNGLT